MPYNYANPDWAPLERAVRQGGMDIRVCGEFMWMCEQPQGVHQYKHRDTRLYAHLTIADADGASKVERAREGR